jgi:hypothetical protein
MVGAALGEAKTGRKLRKNGMEKMLFWCKNNHTIALHNALYTAWKKEFATMRR